MQKEHENFGKNILKYRKLRKIKAIELARRIGIDQSYLSQIENDKRSPGLDVLQKTARELGVTTSDLLGETTPPLDENMTRLVDAAKGLDSTQVDALIHVIEAFGKSGQMPLGNYLVAEEEFME